MADSRNKMIRGKNPVLRSYVCISCAKKFDLPPNQPGRLPKYCVSCYAIHRRKYLSKKTAFYQKIKRLREKELRLQSLPFQSSPTSQEPQMTNKQST